MKEYSSRMFLLAGFIVSSLVMGCGSASTASSSSTGSTTPVSNVQPIAVNAGPALNYADGAFTSVTVCVPGSTTNCQTISGILVDTGSSGLRILSSALSIPLPQQIDSSSNPIVECAAFEDGVTWGPVQNADVEMAGEKASGLPIQVIGTSNFSTVPSACTGQGQPEDTLSALGTNGVLGIGQTIQDCGQYCTDAAVLQNTYFSCPVSGCVATTQTLAKQVQNPVASFATDNNGVIVEFPSVTAPEISLSGSLIFGIGTQSDNGLGSATVYGTDPYGDFSTTYQANTYESFLDSGSNGIYFLDTTTTGLPVCSDVTFLYCPASTATIDVVNTALAGTNGGTAPATFMVGNADLLESNFSDSVINNLAGPFSDNFDFGLPFFFGRKVYVAIDGKSTPGGTGPYTAY